MSSPFEFSGLLERVRQALPSGLQEEGAPRVYLVGGAVRDALLGKASHDLDFVLEGPVLEIARRTANALHAAYYPLDEARQTARVIVTGKGGERAVLDFAAYRGEDLEGDLRLRDFTVNAMALALDEPNRLIDPLRGAEDLRAKRLRICSPTSLKDDPLRTIRGVRLASQFNLLIEPETRKEIRAAAPGLVKVSAERKRDELFRILDGEKPSTGIRALDLLGVLPFLLPELSLLKGVSQSPPHVFDVWEHSLNVVQNLEQVLAVLAPVYDADRAANLVLGTLSMRLGRYREQLEAHLGERFTPDRTARALLFFTALFHDSGKPGTRSVDSSGRIRFFRHEQVGEAIVRQRASGLHLSNEEVKRVSTVIAHHLRPMLLGQNPGLPSARAIYRFFRDTGPAGVDVCLLSLADVMGTYGASLPPEHWGRHLDVVRSLLEAWWEQREDRVEPAPLVDGGTLMEALGLPPGPEVGRLLEALREAQAAGEIRSREEALDWVRQQRGIA